MAVESTPGVDSDELTRGTFAIEIRETFGNETSSAAVVRSTGRRCGLALDDQQVHVFHLQDGRVIDVWQSVGDGGAAGRVLGLTGVASVMAPAEPETVVTNGVRRTRREESAHK